MDLPFLIRIDRFSVGRLAHTAPVTGDRVLVFFTCTVRYYPHSHYPPAGNTAPRWRYALLLLLPHFQEFLSSLRIGLRAICVCWLDAARRATRRLALYFHPVAEAHGAAAAALSSASQKAGIRRCSFILRMPYKTVSSRYMTSGHLFYNYQYLTSVMVDGFTIA